MKRLLPIFIIVILVVGGVAFYGGMKYGQSKITSNRRGVGNFPNFQSLSPEQQQQMTQRFDNRGNIANGEIISKDDQSITIKLRDGGSKIIFFSESTEISKSVSGSLSDLEIGKNITVIGTTNSEGSITAQVIQLRPSSQLTPLDRNR